MEFVFNPLYTGDSKCVLWQTVKTQMNATFHQGLHCLLRQKQFLEKEIQFLFGNYFYLETIYNLWPLKYAMDQS